MFQYFVLTCCEYTYKVGFCIWNLDINHTVMFTVVIRSIKYVNIYGSVYVTKRIQLQLNLISISLLFTFFFDKLQLMNELCDILEPAMSAYFRSWSRSTWRYTDTRTCGLTVHMSRCAGTVLPNKGKTSPPLESRCRRTAFSQFVAVCGRDGKSSCRQQVLVLHHRRQTSALEG